MTYGLKSDPIINFYRQAPKILKIKNELNYLDDTRPDYIHYKVKDRNSFLLNIEYLYEGPKTVAYST